MKLLRTTEVAEQLAVSNRTVQRMIRAGTLRTVKVRGAVRVPNVEIEKLINNQLSNGSDSLCQKRKIAEKTATDSTSARTRRTGGLRSPAQAANKLAKVLELRIEKKPKA